MTWDAYFKRIIEDELSKEKIQVATDLTVGKLPLKIDLVIKILDFTGVKFEILPIILKKLKKDNIFEFKSARDHAKGRDISKLIGYVGLYCDQNNINILEMKDITAWYISAQKPRFIDKLKFEYITKGLYYFDFYFPIYLLVINELKITEQNIPLLLFSSGLKLRKSLEFLIDNKKLKNFLNVAYFLYPKEVSKLFIERELTEEEFTNNIRYAVEKLGIEKVIEAVGLEKVIEAVGLGKVIKAVGLEKVIEEVGLERLVETIGINRLEKIIKEIKEKNSKNSK
ncbi:MAG: hypothetical protein ACTSRP_10435 [Candidatus Helarchaeota archaeon]